MRPVTTGSLCRGQESSSDAIGMTLSRGKEKILVVASILRTITFPGGVIDRIDVRRHRCAHRLGWQPKKIDWPKHTKQDKLLGG
jgi:hypothetical protein